MTMKLPANYEKMTWQERRETRQEYVRLQNGKCYFCKAPLDEPAAADVRRLEINERLFPETFFQYPVHLHHSHTSGMTIGAVHCHCNAVLWQYHRE